MNVHHCDCQIWPNIKFKTWFSALHSSSLITNRTQDNNVLKKRDLTSEMRWMSCVALHMIATAWEGLWRWVFSSKCLYLSHRCLLQTSRTMRGDPTLIKHIDMCKYILNEVIKQDRLWWVKKQITLSTTYRLPFPLRTSIRRPIAQK